MDQGEIVKQLEAIKELDREQHNALETLIKNNYVNLSKDIQEVKENLKVLQLSDKDQEIEIAKLWAHTDTLAKELSAFKENERQYGIQMSNKMTDMYKTFDNRLTETYKEFGKNVDSLRSIPWKIAAICVSAMAVLLTAGGIILNYIVSKGG